MSRSFAQSKYGNAAFDRAVERADPRQRAGVPASTVLVWISIGILLGLFWREVLNLVMRLFGA